MPVFSKSWMFALALSLDLGTAAAQTLQGPDLPRDPADQKELARVLIADPRDLGDKWSKVPLYLKQRIISEPRETWGSILLCNFFGYKSGSPEAKKCETDSVANIKNQSSQWAEDGTFKGPSKDCIARDKRNQYGVLLCD